MEKVEEAWEGGGGIVARKGGGRREVVCPRFSCHLGRPVTTTGSARLSTTTTTLFWSILSLFFPFTSPAVRPRSHPSLLLPPATPAPVTPLPRVASRPPRPQLALEAPRQSQHRLEPGREPRHPAPPRPPSLCAPKRARRYGTRDVTEGVASHRIKMQVIPH